MFDNRWRGVASSGQEVLASSVNQRSTQLDFGEWYAGWATVDIAFAHGGSTVAVASATSDPSWPERQMLEPFLVIEDETDYVACKRYGSTSGKLFLYKVRDQR